MNSSMTEEEVNKACKELYDELIRMEASGELQKCFKQWWGE